MFEQRWNLVVAAIRISCMQARQDHVSITGFEAIHVTFSRETWSSPHRLASMWPRRAQLICRDPRTLPAGGATEVEIARQLSAFGAKMTGLEQYAVAQFAEALEVVPRTIAENSGG